MKVIADLSCNWDTLDDILIMIEHVACDIIKLQYYSNFDLYGTGSRGTKLNIVWMPEIKRVCDANRKDLMCTVFNTDDVDMVNPWVAAHKIASSEITDLYLIQEINKCLKPVYLSTGGASHKQIDTALDLLNDCDVTLMACDVEYPSRRHAIGNMYRLQSEYGDFIEKVGYSDHSADICTFPHLVKTNGGTVLEKHVKPNARNPNYENHALTVDEFNEMINRLAGVAYMTAMNPHQRVFNKELKRWVRPIV